MTHLSRLNGWRRLWLVASIVSLGWFGLVYPFLIWGSDSPGNLEYRRAIERDFRNSDCSRYTFTDFADLSEPPFGNGGTCWHIYTSRSIDRKKHGDQIPYTLPVYDQNHSAWRREQLLMAAAFGSVASLILSAVVYGIGWVIAWIMQGFQGR